MMTDSLGDCFTRLRNGAAAHCEEVKMPYSRMKEAVLLLLKREGFLNGVHVEDREGKKTIIVRLRYDVEGKPILEEIRRMSCPSQRIYSATPRRLQVRGGLGFQILSTSKGIMTDAEAMEKKVGGEVLGVVW